MGQIKSETRLVGKTITEIKYTDMGKRILFFFGDEYAVYTPIPGWEAGDEEIEFSTEDLDIYQKKELDLISVEEYEARKKRAREQYKRTRHNKGE